MTDSSSFSNKNEKNFTNIPEGSEVEFDALFNEEFIKIPEFQTLLNYWTSKRGDRHFPARKDINPMDLKEILPNIFVFELIMQEGQLVDVKASLLGTAVVDLYGEGTGELAKSTNIPEVGKRMLSMCQKCIDTKGPMANQVNVLTPDRPHISISSIYCPLSSNGTDVDKIIGQVTILK